jgi:FAD/FMN-containing dehydrogenase/Fe-S oxidoreductase
MTPLATTLLDDLAGEIEGDVLSDDLSRAMYSTAAGIYQVVPLGVVRPRHHEDIVRTLRWCREHDTPITPRGGGTGPADGCLGRGLILDTAAYLNAEGEIDVHEDTVTVPAGVAYARVNEALAEFGRVLPPDPTAGDYRTIGGMIAANAAGTHSLKYGAIIERIESLEVVLADGTVLETQPLDVRQDAFKELINGAGREARLCHDLYHLLRDKRGPVRSKTPDLPINVSGYRLDRALRRGRFDLGKLLAGSEGTLGILTRATLATAEPAPMSGMLVLYFETVQLAADSIRPVLEAEPCSVELIDARVLELVRANRPDLAHFCRDKVQAVLLVEFDGEDNDEIIPKLMDTRSLLTEDGGTAAEALVATAEPDVAEARALRTASGNLLHNLPGRRRVTPFIDDIAVAPDMISSCVRGVYELLKERDLDAAIGGHAGHGAFAARPLLDLKAAEDVKAMRELAESVFEMVVDMGGTISAGQGDGLPRSEFLRLQYGGLCDVFAEVKQLFDPDGVLNPDIKVGAERGTMVSNLRYGPDYARRPIQPKLLYRDEPRGDAVERCHGCGACRTLSDLTVMCPVYKALRTEEASPRAKANILRHLLSSGGALPPEEELAPELARLANLCVGCKMCSVECPAGVDVEKLVAEQRARQAEKDGLGRDERLARLWLTALPLLATFPGLGNLLLHSQPLRFLAEKLTGLSARRELPRLRPVELSGRHKPTLTQVRDRVVYVTGTYADCFHADVPRAALEVLLRNGAEVEMMSGVDSGETRLAAGDVAGARKLVERHTRRLAPRVEEGFRIVCTDPRTTLFFRTRMLDCVDTPEARAVAAASFDLMQFLLSVHRAGRLDTRFRALAVPFAYHAPCHLRALRIGRPSLELLGLIPDLPVAQLGAGCCGMAGTFGLRAQHFDLSMRIGRPLFEQLKHLDVRYGLTECLSCGLQLQQGSGKRVLHPIQVLHRAYGLSQQDMEAW